jgi:hypothetical protein
MVASTGPTASKHSHVLGTYILMEGVEINGHPVWRHLDNGDKYIYKSSNQQWKIGPDYNDTNQGWIHSVETQSTVPVSNWKYADEDKEWKLDLQLKVISSRKAALF